MDLKFAQALYRCNMLSGDDLPRLALQLIEHGADNSTVCELACLYRPALRDAGPMFERIMRELDIPELALAEARQVAAAGIAKRIAAGTVRPDVGARHLRDLYWDMGNPESLQTFWELQFYYDDYYPEHPLGREAYMATLDKDVVDAAQTYLMNLGEGVESS